MISACNHLRGTVSEMKKGRVTTNVRVAAGGHRITAVIPTSSAEDMGLAIGDEITVLFREVDVLVMKGEGAERVSASNRIPGTVLDIKKGNVTAELPLDIGDGRITAVIARTAAEEMALAVGDRVTAMFREIDVILSKDPEFTRTSARNRFEGAVQAVRHGTVTTELPIAQGDRQVVAVIAKSMSDRMGMAVGDRVTALFREIDVLVLKP
jgi:molybdate transport system regulatory protein